MIAGPLGHAGGTSFDFLPEVARNRVRSYVSLQLDPFHPFTTQWKGGSPPTDHQNKQSTSTEPPMPPPQAFRAFRSTNASPLEDPRMLMQRQALRSQVGGGMAMWHTGESCIGPSIPKCWPKTSKFGAGPKITIRRDIADHFDKWHLLTSFDMFW